MASGKGALHFLGTNGWYSTRTGNTVCAAFETPAAHIVLDAGDGIHRLDRLVAGKKPVHIYLSHCHLDHSGGLHILAKFRFPGGIVVFGQPGTKKALRTLVEHPFTAAFCELKTNVGVRELRAGEHAIRTPFGAYSVSCLPLVHADPCFGYRFDFSGKSLAYCTDTGPCENYLKLAKDAGLLITECGLLPKSEMNPSWPHLSPEMAAELAVAAGCRKLALTHFAANAYASFALRSKAQAVARKIFPNTIAAKDGMEIEI